MFDGNYLSLIMPIGISYYLFEAISYISDIYRDKYERGSFLEVSSYISYFPTIMSGPIIRFNDYKNWSDKKYSLNYDDTADGLRIFIKGLIKKVIIADQLYEIVSLSFNSLTKLNLPLAWIGLIGFALRLYYDFSGCSEMAVGIGKMCGYNIPANFNNPYYSLSVSEFYRRWHITLGSFFRDYVYIPLGGNRVTRVKWIFNIMLVWLLTGIWHGSSLNFVLWGLFLGIVIVLEKMFISKIKLPKWFRWLYTTGVILFSWLIFNTSSFKQLLHYGKALVLGGFSITRNTIVYGLIVLFSLIFMFPFVKKFINKIKEKYSLIYDLLLIVLLMISICLILSGSLVTSMYANF